MQSESDRRRETEAIFAERERKYNEAIEQRNIQTAAADAAARRQEVFDDAVASIDAGRAQGQLDDMSFQRQWCIKIKNMIAANQVEIDQEAYELLFSSPPKRPHERRVQLFNQFVNGNVSLQKLKENWGEGDDSWIGMIPSRWLFSAFVAMAAAIFLLVLFLLIFGSFFWA